MKKFKFVINGNAYEVEVLGFEENIAKIEVNGTEYNVEVQKDLKMTKTPTLVRAESPKPTPRESKIPRTPTQTTNIAIKAPLPGTIITVLVKAGEKVALGQKLLTMEAMKMENNVLSEKDGVVKVVHVKPGQAVAQSEVLVEIE
ncbi:MAG: acetyl-CoA carboxylase biotin carboxyl carrier protein subunit [Bacteroidetes bacterium]|nr:acetyl-CoA carboxylase biotin carboxyl carrier protein subunit [Bacteroidota bacterium]